MKFALWFHSKLLAYGNIWKLMKRFDNLALVVLRTKMSLYSMAMVG